MVPTLVEEVQLVTRPHFFCFVFAGWETPVGSTFSRKAQHSGAGEFCRGSVDGSATKSVATRTCSGSPDKEGGGSVNPIKPGEVQVTYIFFRGGTLSEQF